MDYTRISADCHIDLPWLPPDLFTGNASAAMKDRMPYVAEGPDGPHWTCKKGTSFGLVCGVGPSGQKLVPGQHYRVDVMAATGLRHSFDSSSDRHRKASRLPRNAVTPAASRIPPTVLDHASNRPITADPGWAPCWIQ